jgi:two-component system, LuxR family, response regulator FixJ
LPVKVNPSRTSPDADSVAGPIIHVVDPDERAATFVTELAHSKSIPSRRYESAELFLEVLAFDRPGCVVTEVALPGMSGIQLQERAVAAGSILPMIVVSAISDVAIAVRAMKSGAVNFLTKPYDKLELWESIQTAIQQNCICREQQQTRDELRQRLEQLTGDERRVMKLALNGEPNKTIASTLDISLRTVDFRRSSIMRKMQAKTMIELAQILLLAGLDPQHLLFSNDSAFEFDTVAAEHRAARPSYFLISRR